MAVGGPAGADRLPRKRACRRAISELWRRHEPQVDRDDFYFIFFLPPARLLKQQASLGARACPCVCMCVWAAVCFTVRKGSVCVAQYYASLLFPPTLQRAEPQLRWDFRLDGKARIPEARRYPVTLHSLRGHDFPSSFSPF